MFLLVLVAYGMNGHARTVDYALLSLGIAMNSLGVYRVRAFGLADYAVLVGREGGTSRMDRPIGGDMWRNLRLDPTMATGTSIFEQAYFTEVLDPGNRYDRHNPPHKFAGYLREIRRLRPHGSLLDVGCAHGRFLAAARDHYQCEGVEISEYALTLARKALPDIRLHHAPIETFQPGRVYDVVTCFDVLEHVPDLDAALHRLRGLLVPSGILVIAVPVYDSPPGWLIRMIDHDPTHIHCHGRRFWLERLLQAGFHPIVVQGILRVPIPGYFIHAISRLFLRFSSAIFVICNSQKA